MSLNSPVGPNGYFCACLHLEQQRGSVATVNSCLLNFEAICWKDAGPSQLSWRAPRFHPPFLLPPPPAAFCWNTTGTGCALPSTSCRVLMETLCITWYGVYPWKLHWIPQTPPAGAELDMSVLTAAAIIKLISSQDFVTLQKRLLRREASQHYLFFFK